MCRKGPGYGGGCEIGDTGGGKVILVVGFVSGHLMPETTVL